MCKNDSYRIRSNYTSGWPNLKFLALSTVVSSIFVIHVVNGIQIVNDTWVVGATVTVILPLISTYASLKQQRLDLNTYVL